MTFELSPLIATGVVMSTAATDAVYVMFNAAVTARRPAKAASWSALWYLLAAFAVISYTGNPIYALFAAVGSWIGAFCSVGWLYRSDTKLERAGALPNRPD
jgi:uncharacterized membrane protein YhaH (DUF805 family)